ncbi:MAG: hypothetical protein IKD76_05495 [Clostridia bacterium]|nr:hypothetical protein [Clostridia bacterium]
MSKNKIKNEKAITLIALIVTIIVLLILAGVSIAVLTGDNSILRRSSEAKITTKIAEIEEQANLIYTSELITKLKAPTGDRDVALATVCGKLQEEYGEDKITYSSTEAPQVKSVVINQTELSIMRGGTDTVTATVVPKATSGGAWYAVVEGKYYKIYIPEGKKQIKIDRTETPNVNGGGDLPTATFTSNNAKVTVNESTGAITVANDATGTATITASAGGVASTNECTVTVLSAIGSISVAPTSKTLGTGETAQIGTTNTADIIVTPNASVASTVAEPVTYSYSSVEPTKVSVSNAGVISGEAVTTGSVNVTITATGTISGTTTDSVTVAVTVTPVLGKFQTVVTDSPNPGDGIAYYYTGENPQPGTSTTTEITASNMGQFLGMKVNYTPGGYLTIGSTTVGQGANYRVFYIDVAGKYGNAGTIYLKAEEDSNYATLSSITDPQVSDIATNFNKEWTGSTYASSPAENMTYVNKLLNKNIWSVYKDTAGIANYVVGAPDLEMWVDGYNKFLSKNSPTNGTYYAHNYTVSASTTGVGTNNGKGYYIGINNAYGNNDGYSTATSTMVNSSSYASGSVAADRVKAWNNGGYYWLASPSAEDSNNVMIVYGSVSIVCDYGYDSSLAFCPLVSCNSGVAISEKAE